MVVNKGSLAGIESKPTVGNEYRKELTADQLKAAATRILLSYKYDKVNGMGCAEVVMKAGIKSSNKKRIQIKNIETGIIYETIKAAADSINMDGSSFIRKLKRKRFKQFEYYKS